MGLVVNEIRAQADPALIQNVDRALVEAASEPEPHRRMQAGERPGERPGASRIVLDKLGDKS